MNPQSPPDEAGPLWRLFESSFDALGVWGRLAVATFFAIALLALVAMLAHRKK